MWIRVQVRVHLALIRPPVTYFIRCIGSVYLVFLYFYPDTYMRNFMVRATNTRPDEGKTPNFLSKQYPLCGSYSGTPPSSTDVAVSCKRKTKGKYVYVHGQGNSYLVFSEVGVYVKGMYMSFLCIVIMCHNRVINVHGVNSRYLCWALIPVLR